MRVGKFTMGFHECDKSAASAEWERRERIAAYGDQNMGLGNAKQFERDIGRAIAGFRRTGTPVSISLIDVHLARRPTAELPNAVAEEVALRLLESARLEDCIDRIDEHRYVGVLYNATKYGADLFSERVRRLLATEQVGDGDVPTYLRVDTGSAEWSDNMVTIEALVAAAAASVEDFATALDRERETYLSRSA